MPTISLRITDKELDMFKQYALVNNCSVSEAIRNTMMERIEDEFDIKVFAEYEKEKTGGKVKTYSHEEAWKELGL